MKKYENNAHITTFDWKTYLSKYPDLITNGVNSKQAAINHWLTIGQAEGRTDKLKFITFDWETYIKKYDDLAANGITTREAAINHFLSVGSAEGRTDKIQGVIFDWKTYIAKYPDLTANGINTKDAATAHWHALGKAEGRSDKIQDIQFDWKTYVIKYPDLAANGITTKEAAIDHYLSKGKEEGRSDKKEIRTAVKKNTVPPAPTQPAPTPTPTPTPVSKPPVPPPPTKKEELPKFYEPVVMYEPHRRQNYFLSYMPKWNKSYHQPKPATIPACNSLNEFSPPLNNESLKKYTISQAFKSVPLVPIISIKSNDSIVNMKALPNIDTTIIPKKIFQTWKTYDIPYDMSTIINNNKLAYPDFTFYIYDDKLCKDFIADYFTTAVVDAFNALVPGAFKADLWRYCVLYIHGGIYMDIKFKVLSNLNLHKLIENEYFVKDRPGHFKDGRGVYNGFIIVKPRNAFLLQAIKTIIENVNTKNYGFNPLYPTGPGLLGEIIPADFDFKLIYDCKDNLNIVYLDSKPIIESYTTYRSEQKFTTTKTYGELWHKRSIYA